MVRDYDFGTWVRVAANDTLAMVSRSKSLPCFFFDLGTALADGSIDQLRCNDCQIGLMVTMFGYLRVGGLDVFCSVLGCDLE